MYHTQHKTKQRYRHIFFFMAFIEDILTTNGTMLYSNIIKIMRVLDTSKRWRYYKNNHMFYFRSMRASASGYSYNFSPTEQLNAFIRFWKTEGTEGITSWASLSIWTNVKSRKSNIKIIITDFWPIEHGKYSGLSKDPSCSSWAHIQLVSDLSQACLIISKPSLNIPNSFNKIR